jgi:agmatinase
MTDIGKIFGGTDVSTFLGVPSADISNPYPGIGILGVPLATPYASTGDYAAGAPKAIRDAMATYAAARDHYDFDLGGRLLAAPNQPSGFADIFDYGDTPVNTEDFAANRSSITNAIRTLRQSGAVPVVLGGDDSIPIPVIAGFDDCSPLHVLQFDAHIDWRDDVDGERQGLSSNMRRASEMPHVNGITQVGARGIGSARPDDVDSALAWGANLFPMTNFDGVGIDGVISTLPEGGNLFINLDIDALDPSEMPAVIGPAPGGLTSRQIGSMIAKASTKCRIVGFSMAEFFPRLDTTGLGALTAGRLICNAIGQISRQM